MQKEKEEPMQEIPEKFIVKQEKDVLEKEGIFVHTASPFARKNLYCVPLEAFYTCGPRYDVKRSGLDAYLLFYIKEGELFFEYEARSFIAGAGDVVLLDCIRPHHYKALSRTRFYWIHFDGSASKEYYEHFMEGPGIHFQALRGMEEQFVLVHNMMRGGFPDEGMVSVQIHRILALLFSSVGRGRDISDAVLRARSFMDEHYMEKLTTGQIAEASMLSQSHLFRLFREKTGLSPYGYLMNVRMNHAMKMLLETHYSVEEIADACAFCSSANFIRAFRQSTGMTPHKFRKLIRGMTSSM